MNLGPLQPIEAIRLLLALFLAGFFARRWELLRACLTRGGRRTLTCPRWLNVPRVRIRAAGAARRRGRARVLLPAEGSRSRADAACVFLAVYAAPRGGTGLADVAGSALLVAGFYLGYRLEFRHAGDRVRMWQSPWDNAARGGDQIAHAIWAFATGGPWGAGLGLGDTRYLPAGHTDLVLAAVGEELGARRDVSSVAVLYAALVWRALSHRRAGPPSDYGFFLAVILTLFLIVPVLRDGGRASWA